MCDLCKVQIICVSWFSGGRQGIHWRAWSSAFSQTILYRIFMVWYLCSSFSFYGCDFVQISHNFIFKLLFPLIQLENAVCEFVSLKLSGFSLWIWGMGVILAYSIVRFHTWKGNPEEFLLPIINFCESCLTHWWSVSTFNFQEVTEPGSKMEWTRARIFNYTSKF